MSKLMPPSLEINPEKACCNTLTVPPSHSALLGRLNRITGQVEGIKRMIQEQRYCPDILAQLRASRAALKGVESKILEAHLQACVQHALEAGDAVERSTKIDELLELFRKNDDV